MGATSIERPHGEGHPDREWWNDLGNFCSRNAGWFPEKANLGLYLRRHPWGEAENPPGIREIDPRANQSD